mgnify:CR=1 FL=1
MKIKHWDILEAVMGGWFKNAVTAGKEMDMMLVDAIVDSVEQMLWNKYDIPVTYNTTEKQKGKQDE